MDNVALEAIIHDYYRQECERTYAHLRGLEALIVKQRRELKHQRRIIQTQVNRITQLQEDNADLIRDNEVIRHRMHNMEIQLLDTEDQLNNLQPYEVIDLTGPTTRRRLSFER
jgi:hypothetical protein